MAEKRIVFTTKKVEEVSKKLADGYQIARENNPWWQGEVGVRKSGLTFSYTKDELEEYYKCAVDVHYFAEQYCEIKAEDGAIKNIKLRDYQKDILDLYDDNRFSILCASRQVGKCNTLATKPFVKTTLVDGSTVEAYVPFYKLYFYAKKKKNILDYIKYSLYFLIDKLEK